MSETSEASLKFSLPAPLVALASWLLPGLGYVLIGQKLRGGVIGVTIIFLFITGLLLAGIRVIDVPGFDDRGFPVYISAGGQKVTDPESGRWALRARPLNEIANKPWFVGQFLAGPVCLASAHYSLQASHPEPPGTVLPRIPRSHGRIYEIGTLYTAIAGMLNLLAIIDSAHRAGKVNG